MAIVRNSLAKGNDHVVETLKETKHDKEKTFDKIVLMMYENCERQISERQMIDILHPDDILVLKNEHLKLIDFNKNVFSIIGPFPSFTKRETEIIKEINEV